MDDAIKKLRPGTVDLTNVAREAVRLDKARAGLDSAIEGRAAAIKSADDAGAELQEIAKAAGVTIVRVRQILRGRR